jgi:hypothetical protein
MLPTKVGSICIGGESGIGCAEPLWGELNQYIAVRYHSLSFLFFRLCSNYVWQHCTIKMPRLLPGRYIALRRERDYNRTPDTIFNLFKRIGNLKKTL